MSLKLKRRSTAVFLPDEFMIKTVDIIKAAVSYMVMTAVVRKVVLSHDRNLLVENCGHSRFSDK